MTWQAVARKDFQDAVRSRWLWGLSVFFALFFTVPAYFLADRLMQLATQQGQSISSDAFLGMLSNINSFFIPAIAIVIAYAAIAGERDSGTLKLLLSLPHSRRDVVLGKVVGRAIVMMVPVLVGFIPAALVFLITGVDFAPVHFAAFALLTSVLGLVFVAISVGMSAAAESGRRAMLAVVGTFVIFTLFWNTFAQGVLRLLSRYTDASNEVLVKVHLTLRIINPTQAYKTLVFRVTRPAMDARVSLIGGFQGQSYKSILGDSLPVYLSDPAVIAVLVIWLVALPILGYLVFEEADL